jgi:SAM-dependent methyltransferase
MNPPPKLDHLAGLYRWMEAVTFGPWLGWCRREFLGEMSECRRALVLGDGDGRFAARLLDANPAVEVDAVDASPGMLRALLRRAGAHADRVCTHCMDVRLWRPTRPPYDMVVTHFMLDCLTGEEVSALAQRLRGAVSPSALWVVSEFAIPKGGFGRWVARPVVSGLYLGFRWLAALSVNTLPDHPSALSGAGFVLRRRRTRLAGLLVAELWVVGGAVSACE